MQVGRNDPCPCGSGRKYKKCCLAKEPRGGGSAAAQTDWQNHAEHDRLVPGEVGDYGEPDLSLAFFAYHQVADVSPPMLMCFSMRAPDEAAGLWRRVTQMLKAEFLQQSMRQKAMIAQAKSAASLVAWMKHDVDIFQHGFLIERLREKADETVPLILAEMDGRQRRIFYEIAAQVLYQCYKNGAQNVVAEVQALAERRIESAYGLSLLCMLLGMIGDDKAFKPLWDCYHFLKEKFPERCYYEGPLRDRPNVRPCCVTRFGTSERGVGVAPRSSCMLPSTMFFPRAESNGRTTILYVMRVTSGGIRSDFRDGAAQQRSRRIGPAGARRVRLRVQ